MIQILIWHIIKHLLQFWKYMWTNKRSSRALTLTKIKIICREIWIFMNNAIGLFIMKLIWEWTNIESLAIKDIWKLQTHMVPSVEEVKETFMGYLWEVLPNFFRPPLWRSRKSITFHLPWWEFTWEAELEC